MALPDRSQRITENLLVSFDVDCGELVPGHHFIARGLSDQGFSRDDFTDSDPAGREEYRMTCLEYELVPGLTPEEVAAGHVGYQAIDAAYAADVPPSWDTGDSRSGPGSLYKATGGPSTEGQCGPHPLPQEAQRVSFTLFPITREGIAKGRRAAVDEPAGTLAIDLIAKSAVWQARN